MVRSTGYSCTTNSRKIGTGLKIEYNFKILIMTINTFLEKLHQHPDTISFQEVISIIDANYIFSPTAFTNGTQKNNAGENSGSCKLFSFAKAQKLTKEETLLCFGEYYQSVLDHPNGIDHQNIRNFMNTGWDAIVFQGNALVEK